MLCAFPAIVSAQQIGPAGFDPSRQTLGPGGAIYQSRAVPNYRHLGQGYYRITPPNYRYYYSMTTLRGNVVYRPNFDPQYRYGTYRGWGYIIRR